MIWKQRIPKPDYVFDFKFLREHQHEPPKRVILRVQALLLEMGVEFRVYLVQQEIELFDSSVDACRFVVHCANEAVSDLWYYYVEAKEQVAFEELVKKVVWQSRVEKAVVKVRQYFIHALDILHAWIQLCINEQYPAQNISMCFYIV